MRIWGRVYSSPETYQWTQIDTQANGNNDNVYITNLIQVLFLAIGESPFFANFGIPAQRSVIQQIFPDFYVNQTQQQFAQFFTSLQVTKINSAEPTYKVALTTTSGRTVEVSVPI